MHRTFRKYAVSLLVVPGLLLGVVFVAIAAAPGASIAAPKAHMTHAVLVSASPQDGGTVTAQNSAFTTQDSQALSPGPGTLTAGATDTDQNADGSYLVSLYSSPSNGNLTLDSNNDGGFTYNADPAFVGTDSFQFTLTDSDGNVSAPATVTITVEGVTSASDTTYSIPDSASWSVPAGVLLTGASDTSTSATCCTASLSTAPSNGTVSVDSNGAGSFTYTPNSGFQGTDSFSYTLTDSVGNVSASTTVNFGVAAPAPTKTSIIETNPPATGTGDRATFVAQVKQIGGGPTPTGTVTFTYYTVGDANGGPQTGTLGSAALSGGEATLTTTAGALPAGGPQNGSITINATYNGDALSAASNGLIEYYVLPGCSLGQWPAYSSGYPSILAGGPEGYYIGQSNGWYTLYATHPAGSKQIFSGTVTTGPSGENYTDGIIIDLSSTKNEGFRDKVTLVGANKLTFKLVNGGDLDGFSFFAGCGTQLTFTLNIGHNGGVPAKRKQIFIGANSTKSPTPGGVEFTRP